MYGFGLLQERMTDACYARLSDAWVQPVHGEPFPAQFDPTSRLAFDVAQVGDYVLRYRRESADLLEGDLLDIAEITYRVAQPPAEINADECVVQLVRVG